MFTSWSHLIIYYIIGSFHLGSPWNLPQKCRTHFDAPLPNIECILSEKCLIVRSIREAEWCVCLFDKVDLSAHTLCVCYRSCGLNFSHDGSNASGRLPESYQSFSQTRGGWYEISEPFEGRLDWDNCTAPVCGLQTCKAYEGLKHVHRG